MKPLVVLAYSGGLDTSAIVPWLRETRDADVICFAADVGQGPGELDGLKEKAIRSGARDCIIVDLRETFVRDFIFPTVKAGAVYSRTYLLGTAMARPAIAAAQVEAAREVGATAVAHGCTGKGNDQVRFELTYACLAPELDVIAPWREWHFRGREDLLNYIHSQGMSVDATREKLFSRDRNLWHCSHEGGVLEDPSVEPPPGLFLLTNDPAAAPEEPEEFTIEFEQGEPVAIDGVPYGPVQLIERLNELAGRQGVGRADIIEDRLVGMKSRGVYETPGGTVLRAAHRDLEQLVLDRRTLDLKDSLTSRYADLVYEGRWWSPEREAMDALVAATQRYVTGDVRMRLSKGMVLTVSRRSPHAVYSAELATFEADDIYDQADAGGFIRLFSLPHRMTSRQARETRSESGAVLGK